MVTLVRCGERSFIRFIRPFSLCIPVCLLYCDVTAPRVLDGTPKGLLSGFGKVSTQLCGYRLPCGLCWSRMTPGAEEIKHWSCKCTGGFQSLWRVGHSNRPRNTPFRFWCVKVAQSVPCLLRPGTLLSCFIAVPTLSHK